MGPKRRAASSAVTARSPRTHSLRVNRSCVTRGCGMGLSCAHDVPQLRRVDVLLEARDLAVAQLPDVTDLGIEMLARRLVDARVATLDDDPVAGIVKIPGRDREAVPLSTSPHEEVPDDRVRPAPGLAAWRVGMAFGQAPFDAGIEGRHDARNVPAPEQLVDVFHDLDTGHTSASSSTGWSCHSQSLEKDGEAILENLAVSSCRLAEPPGRDTSGTMERADEVREVTEPDVECD